MVERTPSLMLRLVYFWYACSSSLLFFFWGDSNRLSFRAGHHRNTNSYAAALLLPLLRPCSYIQQLAMMLGWIKKKWSRSCRRVCRCGSAAEDQCDHLQLHISISVPTARSRAMDTEIERLKWAGQSPIYNTWREVKDGVMPHPKQYIYTYIQSSKDCQQRARKRLRRRSQWGGGSHQTKARDKIKRWSPSLKRKING